MNFQFVPVLMLLSLPGAVAAPPQGGEFAVVPGQRIGHISLGPNGRRELARLPKPAAFEAGMSQTRSVWVSQAHGSHQRDTLYIHTVSNGALNVKPLSGVTIDTIRVTSPRFHTVRGLGPGSSLRQIRRVFPQARPAQRSRALFDDAHAGIAFEFAKVPRPDTRCIAVMVHPRDDAHTVSAREVDLLLRDAPKPLLPK